MLAKFITQQLDYILFIYGLAFIILVVVCINLLQDHKRSLPWAWLALFALFHGVGSWMEGVVLAFSGSPIFSAAQVLFRVVAFIFLFEFAREGDKKQTGKGPGRWIYIPILACVGLSGLWGLSAINVAARYTFGLVGGCALPCFQTSKITLSSDCIHLNAWLCIDRLFQRPGRAVPTGLNH
jgi:uncharacterized membrane protein